MVKQKVLYGASGEDATHGDSVDAAASGNSGLPLEESPEKPLTGDGVVADDPNWLEMARNAYEDAHRFNESSLRAQWERNQRAFQSRHPSGSKYYADAYKHRTKLFRPKTRSVIRQSEANIASSYFSNEDLTSVKAVNANNPRNRASAEVIKEVLQHRLSVPDPRVGIPWFITVVGAYQEARVIGHIVSKQSWEYQERKSEKRVPLRDAAGEQLYDEKGEPQFTMETVVTVLKDRPRIDLMPPENVFLDRGCDWRDPINTSPFLIVQHPMYLYEVEDRAKQTDPKTGQPRWKNVGRPILKQAGSRQHWDSTRSQREGHREDSKESEIAIDEFTVVWVHENIIAWRGTDWVYWTAGTHAMLSDPKPLEEVYLHARPGQRPYVMGYSIIEAHKTWPSGIPQLTEGLQREANEIVNLRLDNVKLAMNHRWLVKRGKRVDLRSLLRSAPGSSVLVDNPDEDVKMLETKEVTQSSYREQDRVNADYDELAGSFSTGSVQTNRSLNETVGGMQLMKGSGDNIAELDLRVFTETWAEPVLRQMTQMIQVYETDDVILALAGENANLYQKYGISEIDDDLIERDLVVKVNVGLGATDPMQRLGKMQIAADIIEKIFPPGMIVPLLNAKELIKEIFAPLGYRDGSRFFRFGQEDPTIKFLESQIQQMKREKQKRELEQSTKKEVAQTNAMAKVISQLIDTEGRTDAATAKQQHEVLMLFLEQLGLTESDERKAEDALDIESVRGIQGLLQAAAKANGRPAPSQ